MPFGKGTRTFGSAPANDNSTGFTGHLEDDASGLVYMQARYYDPLVPRFLSADPIGYQDQLNLYAYVANDPVNKTDPHGEESICTTCGVGSPLSNQIGLALVDLAPVIGDAKGAYELGQNPSWRGAAILAVGIVPGGDLAKNLKRFSSEKQALVDMAKKTRRSE